MTMQTVIGASLGPNLTIFCGTLSSRMRKLAAGMFGIKFPRLSSTATSTVTRFVEASNVGSSAGTGVLLPRAGAGAGGGSAFFLGRATVSPGSRVGP